MPLDDWELGGPVVEHNGKNYFGTIVNDPTSFKFIEYVKEEADRGFVHGAVRASILYESPVSNIHSGFHSQERLDLCGHVMPPAPNGSEGYYSARITYTMDSVVEAKFIASATTNGFHYAQTISETVNLEAPEIGGYMNFEFEWERIETASSNRPEVRLLLRYSATEGEASFANLKTVLYKWIEFDRFTSWMGKRSTKTTGVPYQPFYNAIIVKELNLAELWNIGHSSYGQTLPLPAKEQSILYMQGNSFTTRGVPFRRYSIRGPGIEEDAPFSPTDAPNLVLWLRASDLVLNDNDPVTTWTNFVGAETFGNTGTARPTFKTAIMNGLPVVRFDGTNDILVGNANHFRFAAGTGLTAFFVLSHNYNATQGLYLASGNTSARNYQMGTADGTQPGKDAFGICSSGTTLVTRLTTVAFDTNAPSVRTFRYEGGVDQDIWHSTLNVNGTISASVPASLVGPNVPIAIGGLPQGTGLDFLPGDIAEVLLYERALTDNEVAEVQAYLHEKYAVPDFGDIDGEFTLDVVYDETWETFSSGGDDTVYTELWES